MSRRRIACLNEQAKHFEVASSAINFQAEKDSDAQTAKQLPLQHEHVPRPLQRLL